MRIARLNFSYFVWLFCFVLVVQCHDFLVDQSLSLQTVQEDRLSSRIREDISDWSMSDRDDGEPSDLEIWLAIKNSLDEWNKQRLERERAIQNGSSSLTRRKRDEDQSVCYEHFGCFKHKGPFDYLNTLPASPEAISTTFTLYTRRNPKEGESLHYDDSIRSNSSTFNSTNDVKIIIHGFGSSSKRPWVMKMTEMLLELDDFNVINVDWQNGSKLPNYVQAAANTQLIGKQIAKIIRTIERHYHVPPSRYHLIGFSLGAHVAGFTGQEIANISRITGLDPASPLFEGYPPNVRLDPSDARFVDVIHSNGDGFIRGGLGSYEPMGSVDFYPNGGRVQVGCTSALGVLSNIFYHGQWNLLCNHRRAFRFFIDSMHQGCTFRAFSCSSYEDYVQGKCFDCGQQGQKCSNMGYYSHQSKGRGPMYLTTRDKEPFCVNQFRIQIQFSKRQGVTWGQIELQLINNDGLNETFILTQEVDQLKESERIQTLIVAHPKLSNITELTLTYTRYKGWIYYGQNEWNVDRIELLDSNFAIQTYCRPRTVLFNGIAIRLKLLPTNCSIEEFDYENHSSSDDEDNGDEHGEPSNAIVPEPVTTAIPFIQPYLHGYYPRLYGQSFYGYIIPSGADKSEQYSGKSQKNNEKEPVKVYDEQLKNQEQPDALAQPQELSSLMLLEAEHKNFRPSKIESKKSFTRGSVISSSTMERSILTDQSRARSVDEYENPKTSMDSLKKSSSSAEIKSMESKHKMIALPATSTINGKSIVVTAQGHQQQQQSLISPILNGASKIFWKFWNNFNVPLDSNNVHRSNTTTASFEYSTPDDVHQLRTGGVGGGGGGPESAISDAAAVAISTIASMRPRSNWNEKNDHHTVANLMHVDRVLVLMPPDISQPPDVVKRSRSMKSLVLDGEHQDEQQPQPQPQQQQQQQQASSSYVVYSMIPISSTHSLLVPNTSPQSPFSVPYQNGQQQQQQQQQQKGVFIIDNNKMVAS